MSPRRSRLFFVAAAVALSGCTATIYRAGQPAIEGRLVGGDDDHLAVRNAGGEVFRVPRAEIVDVDHPGNTWWWYPPYSIIPGFVVWWQSVQAAEDTSLVLRDAYAPLAPHEVQVREPEAP